MEHADALLAGLARLGGLSEAERAILGRACSAVLDVAKDQDIAREGDRPTACNLLLEGFVHRYTILPDGRRQILAFHVPGDFYDGQSYLLPRMDHGIAALTPCRVALIPHRAMDEISEAHPRLARALWRETLMDAALHRQLVVSLGRRDAAARLAHLMCELFLRLQAVGLARGNQIDWPMTQADMGDGLGLTSVHVNRTLGRLRREGLITLHLNLLTIHDWNRLAHTAGFDPHYLHLEAGGLRPVG